MPLYAGNYAICAFLQNMPNMLRSHDRYKPVSLNNVHRCVLVERGDQEPQSQSRLLQSSSSDCSLVCITVLLKLTTSTS